MLKRIPHYLRLLTTDKTALRFQLWMVWNRYKINTFKWLSNRYLDIFGSFLTFHTRPTKTSNIGTWSRFKTVDASIAIVLQGPLVLHRNFTLETVRLYKQHYPTSSVIVSVWDEESPKALASLQQHGAIVVTSKKPTICGIGNVNLQLVTTLAGMKKAKELGMDYAYKTRCDQRMYAPDHNSFLYHLLHTFPVRGTFAQKYRIAGTSFGTLKFVPYLFTDVFQFGHIDDMITYWSAPHDSRSAPSKFIHSVKDLMDERMCESYLCSTYLTTIGRTPHWTVADWWRVVADHFVVVDSHATDLFFYKYNFYQEHRTRSYKGIPNDAVVTFSDWLTLYADRDASNKAIETGLVLGRKDILAEPEPSGHRRA